MLEIKINVNAPDLANAINNLANALSAHTPVSLPQTAEPNTSKPIAADPAETPAPKVEQTEKEVAKATQVTSEVQAAQPAKQITLDDLSKAGSALLDLGKMPQLMALLKKYGVQAITQLSPDKYNEFAVELNALGANL